MQNHGTWHKESVLKCGVLLTTILNSEQFFCWHSHAG